MTVVGSGGAVIKTITVLETFKRDHKKLDTPMKDRVDAKLDDLLKDPRPPGLRFEKLKGYRRPDIYTIHVTGNYKIPWKSSGPTHACDESGLTTVGPHNYIDRTP